MKNASEEIKQYMQFWDQAKKSFPSEKKSVRPVSSFLGLQNNVVLDDISEEESNHWKNIYDRSLEIDPDMFNGEENLLSEEEIDQQCLAGLMDIKEAKEAKKKTKKSKKAKNSSKSSRDVRKPKDGEEVPELDEEKDGFGKDLAKKLGDAEFTPNPVHFASIGADSDLRVTPNFTDGSELRQLAKLKSLLYDLETELLGTDVRGDDPEPIRVKMLAVRRQCESLSQRLIPDPRNDVS